MTSFLKLIFIGFSFLLVTNSDLFAYNLTSDTLRQKKVNGIKVKLYKIQAKDTWSSISRKSKVSVAYLMSVNNGVDNLKPGQIINIPMEEVRFSNENATREIEVPLTKTEATAPAKESRYMEAVYHTVKKGETLFRISKNYSQTLENLITWNGIKHNELKVGQKLVVNYVYKYHKNTPDQGFKNEHVAAGAEITKEQLPGEEKNKNKKIEIEKEHTGLEKPKSVSSPQNTMIASSDKSNPGDASLSSPVKPTFTTPVGKIVRPILETGVASWIMDGESNQNKYYALHRSAPVGTIIKVTNRMNGKSVFVKVVGLLPDSGDNDNLIIKISQAASTKINVLDSRFQAELSYGVAE